MQVEELQERQLVILRVLVKVKMERIELVDCGFGF